MKKIGRIYISHEFIDRFYEKDSILKYVFNEFIPIHVNFISSVSGCAEYIGMCEKFTGIVEGSEIPVYEVLVSPIDNEKFSVDFKIHTP